MMIYLVLLISYFSSRNKIKICYSDNSHAPVTKSMLSRKWTSTMHSPTSRACWKTRKPRPQIPAPTIILNRQPLIFKLSLRLSSRWSLPRVRAHKASLPPTLLLFQPRVLLILLKSSYLRVRKTKSFQR